MAWSKQEREIVKKPSAILDYIKFMGSVDKADQFVTYHGFPHFSKKWWKIVFYHLLDTAAYIIGGTLNNISSFE